MQYREEWLAEAIKQLQVQLFDSLFETPMQMPAKWQVTCGWSKGSSTNTLGVCVDPKCSKDGTTHLFVIPTRDDSMSILSTLVHEMIHAIVGISEGHKGLFRDSCLHLGMSKPMTSSNVQPETPAWEILEKISAQLGPYPHAAMVPIPKPSKPSQWIRWRSPKCEEYTVLANIKKVDEHGAPKDPWGNEMVPCNREYAQKPPADPRQEPLFDSGEDGVPGSDGG